MSDLIPHTESVHVPEKDKYSLTRGTKIFIGGAVLIGLIIVAVALTITSIGWANAEADIRDKDRQIEAIQGSYNQLYQEFLDTNGNEEPTTPTPEQISQVAGTQGPQGLPGSQGLRGPKGEMGERGQSGPAGEAGAPGVDGLPGANGVDGESGMNGADGENGSSGADGENGAPGANGSAGAPGPAGPQGPQGEPGPQGLPGLPGADATNVPVPGPQGEQGLPGLPGEPGVLTCPGGGTPFTVTIPTAEGSVNALSCG